MHKLSLGISPCPNDTYIFEALVHGRIREDLCFDLHFEDVERLNQLAFKRSFDITKVSIHASFFLLDKYKLLRSGGAFGQQCGPLLINRSGRMPKKGIIAIPGPLTTAALLFQLAVPGDFKILSLTFDKIMPAIVDGIVDAGVIIHESRFTFANYGLKKVLDLGSWWENETGCLIPLGGIMVAKDLPDELIGQLELDIRKSILEAHKNPKNSKDFIKKYAQELEDKVIDDHIGLYVNEYSLDYGSKGQKALSILYDMSSKKGLIPNEYKSLEENLLYH